ncbi:thioredoxin domain-containing protein [Tuberibacillus sp. Marseille-P3662]|uniref:thioredoxin domain-containing protein n=1 Tax=Tuberibacillus sp. Marseille-P3662 TaxID=1965358 RepID=UPI000A1CEEAE|nr:thioredoxin domain-containing protein [Tuberibacillus sp. Marseille-P3662]
MPLEEMTSDSLKCTEEQTLPLLFETPFCQTCQLAKKMIGLTEQALSRKVTTYVCRASEWEALVNEWKIESVPCLVFVRNHQFIKKVYAIESVTKLYQLYEQYIGESCENGKR